MSANIGAYTLCLQKNNTLDFWS